MVKSCVELPNSVLGNLSGRNPFSKVEALIIQEGRIRLEFDKISCNQLYCKLTLTHDVTQEHNIQQLVLTCGQNPFILNIQSFVRI